MLHFLKRLPGRLIRLSAMIGVSGILLAWLATVISPSGMPWLAFFGLSYLFWLIVAIAGLIYALLRRRWVMLVIVVIVLLFSSDLLFRTFAFGGSSGDEADLTVMSYNVRLFDLYNWTEGSKTRDEIFDFLQENPVDVICFQEFYYTDRKGIFETRDTLVEFLQNRHYHERYTHEMNGQQYFGVVTFSRYPILERGEMPFASDINNFCIYTDLLVDDDTVRVYNAHLASIRFQQEDYRAIEEGPDPDDAKRLASRLDLAFRKRASQVEKIAAHVRKSPYPVILCGDFNDTPVSYAYQSFQAELDDAFREGSFGIGATYVGRLPFFRIDYILHDPSMVTTYFRTHDERHSDHRPIEAGFRF